MFSTRQPFFQSMLPSAVCEGFHCWSLAGVKWLAFGAPAMLVSMQWHPTGVWKQQMKSSTFHAFMGHLDFFYVSACLFKSLAHCHVVLFVSILLWCCCYVAAMRTLSVICVSLVFSKRLITISHVGQLNENHMKDNSGKCSLG